MGHRIFTTAFGDVWPHYVTKVERKGRSVEELDAVVEWLTGFDADAVRQHVAAGTTFEEFFAAATLNPAADLVTGSVCGVKLAELDDPLMWRIRVLDKLVDELAKGKALEKVLRG